MPEVFIHKSYCPYLFSLSMLGSVGRRRPYSAPLARFCRDEVCRDNEHPPAVSGFDEPGASLQRPAMPSRTLARARIGRWL